MVRQSGGGALGGEGVPEYTPHQIRRHPGVHRMADDLAGEQILDADEIQPAFCGRHVMSVTQVAFGRVATNVWATTFSATGRACVESVVIVNRRTWVQRMFSFLRSRLMRPIPTGKPSSRSSAWSRSGPYVWRVRQA